MQFFTKWVVLGLLLMGLVGCGSDQHVAPAPLPGNGPVGSVVVSRAVTHVASSMLVPYGQTAVSLNEFDVAMDDVEDGILEFVVPEIYSEVYQELFPTFALQNLRLMQSGIQVGPTTACVTQRPAAPENGWINTTYAYIPSGFIIPSGTRATFRIVGDVGWSWLDRVVVTLPDAGSGMFSDGIGSHVIVRGATSGKILKVKGEAIGTPVHLYEPFPTKG